MKADLPISGYEDIPWVRIPMEDAEDKDLMQIRIDKVLSQTRTVRLNDGIIDMPAAASLLNDDGLADETVDSIRNVYRWRAGKGCDEALDVARLLSEVDFLFQIAPDLVDDARRLVVLKARHPLSANRASSRALAYRGRSAS